MDLKETLISSEEVFSGNVVKVSVDNVRLPNKKRAKREVVRHAGAACILAITPKNKVILVRQYRYATGETLYEIPAGKLDQQGELASEAALRELAEETPYTAQEAVLLHTFFTSPGFCDEKIYLYQAKGLKKNSSLSADEDEFVDTVLWSKKKVKKSLKQHRIQDAKTIIALQTWLLQKK